MTRPLRLLHVINSLELGGAETRLVSLLKGLDRRRFAPEVAYFLGPGTLVGELEEAGVPCSKFPLDRLPSAPLFGQPVPPLLGLARTLRRGRFAICHTHLVHAGLLGRFAARLASTPVLVHTQHCAFHSKELTWFYRLDRRTWWMNRAIIALSEAIARYVREHRPRMRVEVIRTGIDPAAFAAGEEQRASARQRMGIPEGTAVIGTVANFRDQKGYGVLVPALARVRQSYPNFVAIFAGHGPLRDQVWRSLAEHGLEKQVRIIGTVRDVREVLHALDLFVLSSHWEGFGKVLIEAMASGLPVVATRVEAIPEVVPEGVAGLLVRPGDPYALAEAILSLLGDPERSRALGANGVVTVREKFDERRMIGEVEALYEELLGGR